MERRKFIKNCGCLAAASLAAAMLDPGRDSFSRNRVYAKGTAVPKVARYFSKRDNNIVQCTLCPWQCIVGENARGICRTKENRKGTYYTLAYGNPCSINIDPIEKKPLYHFMPGTMAFSLATGGCNFRCKFCQNWQISQTKPDELETELLLPENVVESARRGGTHCLAFTYAEPIAFYDYMLDTAQAARAAGLKSVVISNGFINADPLKELALYINAYKVDLKSFRQKYYQDICEGQLQPVLDTLVRLKNWGCGARSFTWCCPRLTTATRRSGI